MKNAMGQWFEILTAMSVGLTGVEIDDDNKPPPSKAEQEKAAQALKTSEEQLAETQKKLESDKKLVETLEALAKTIEAMEKTLAPIEAQAKASPADADLAKDAADMKKLLESFKARHKQYRDNSDKDAIDVNRLKRELQEVLAHYYETANLEMIAKRAGVAFDGNMSFALNTEFMQRAGNNDQWQRYHFGMGVEPTDDRKRIIRVWEPPMPGVGGIFDIMLPHPPRGTRLSNISQHEQQTTDIMYQTAAKLLHTSDVPMARLGIMVHDFKSDEKKEFFKATLGHPNGNFRPSVINNSIGFAAELQNADTFHEWLHLYTQGKNTRVFHPDNGTITYDVPPISRTIVGNAEGNSGWGSSPNFSIIQHFHPFHVNIGVSAIPAQKGLNKRDDNAQPHVEGYSTSNSSVYAIIQRPRWNADGTPVKTRDVNPEYKKMIEADVWRLGGYEQVPTKAELDDEKKFPPAKVAAIKKDVAHWTQFMCETVEQADSEGFTDNLRGTSFAAPVANGVMLAARRLFPDASEAEIIDAFCSSCVPITRRQDTDEAKVYDDINYQVRGGKIDVKNGKVTGMTYSPMVGFGEFIINPKATPDNPDSWLKLQDRLKQMQQKRMELTHNGRKHEEITIGTGKDKRKTLNDGQPIPVTLELNRMEDVAAPQNARIMLEQQNKVLDVFKALEMSQDLSFMSDGSSEYEKHIKAGKFNEALNLLGKEYMDSGILSRDSSEYKAVVAAVEEAENMRQNTYSFTVYEGQDISCVMSGLRLSFKDKNKTDDCVVIESPDGTRIPLILTKNEGVGLASTPGFMRQSVVGTWKIYTRSEINKTESTLFLAGTERNKQAGIIDVRDILSEIEAKEAKSLPEKNIIKPIADPHEMRREVIRSNDAIVGKNAMPKIIPNSPEGYRRALQMLIDTSELKKGGFIKDIKVEMSGLVPTMPGNALAMRPADRFKIWDDMVTSIIGNTSTDQAHRDVPEIPFAKSVLAALKMDDMPLPQLFAFSDITGDERPMSTSAPMLAKKLVRT